MSDICLMLEIAKFEDEGEMRTGFGFRQMHRYGKSRTSLLAFIMGIFKRAGMLKDDLEGASEDFLEHTA